MAEPTWFDMLELFKDGASIALEKVVHASSGQWHSTGWMRAEMFYKPTKLIGFDKLGPLDGDPKLQFKRPEGLALHYVSLYRPSAWELWWDADRLVGERCLPGGRLTMTYWIEISGQLGEDPDLWRKQRDEESSQDL